MEKLVERILAIKETDQILLKSQTVTCLPHWPEHFIIADITVVSDQARLRYTDWQVQDISPHMCRKGPVTPNNEVKSN